MPFPKTDLSKKDQTELKKLVGVVLIGGKSKRMGKDKVCLLLQGKPMIEYVRERLSKIFSQIVLIGPPRTELKKFGEIYSDLIPSLGPLSGIYTALKIIQSPVFICGADMPFLNSGLIRYQVKVLKNFDAVVPRPEGKYEPLHSIYTPACLPAIEQLIQEGKKRPVEMFNQIQLREISDQEILKFDPQRLSFFNINTVSDLHIAEKILQTTDSKKTNSLR